MDLIISGLTKTYANGVRAINNISLTIPPGSNDVAYNGSFMNSGYIRCSAIRRATSWRTTTSAGGTGSSQRHA